MTADGIEAGARLRESFVQSRLGVCVDMQFQAQRHFQLLALLVLDVGLHNRWRDVSYCPDRVTSCPQTRHFHQVRKLLPEYVRGVALHLCDDVVGREIGCDGNDEVNVVGHDFESNHFVFKFGAFSAYQRLTTRRHVSCQALPAVLWAENEVQIEIVDSVARFLIVGTHQEHCSVQILIYQQKTRKGGRF